MLRDLVSPSAMSGLLCAIASAAVLLVGNATTIIYQIGTADNQYYFNRLAHQYLNATFSRLNEAQLIGQLTVFLVWAGIGAALYVLLWLGVNSYIALHNEFVIGTTYTTVEAHGRLRYAMELGARGIFRACSIVLILLLAAMAVQVWYPIAATLFGIWVNNVSVLFDWAFLLEALIGWALVLHTFVILLRLVMLRTRVLP